MHESGASGSASGSVEELAGDLQGTTNTEWAPEELNQLEEALARFPADKHTPVERYIQIAALLPSRTARDVALKVKQQQQRQQLPVLLTQPQGQLHQQQGEGATAGGSPHAALQPQPGVSVSAPGMPPPTAFAAPGVQTGAPQGPGSHGGAIQAPQPIPAVAPRIAGAGASASVAGTTPPAPAAPAATVAEAGAAGTGAGPSTPGDIDAYSQLNQVIDTNYNILNDIKANMAQFRVSENMQLLVRFRDNLQSIQKTMSGMGGAMAQMPALPVQPDFEKASKLFPDPSAQQASPQIMGGGMPGSMPGMPHPMGMGMGMGMFPFPGAMPGMMPGGFMPPAMQGMPGQQGQAMQGMPLMQGMAPMPGLPGMPHMQHMGQMQHMQPQQAAHDPGAPMSMSMQSAHSVPQPGASAPSMMQPGGPMQGHMVGPMMSQGPAGSTPFAGAGQGAPGNGMGGAVGGMGMAGPSGHMGHGMGPQMGPPGFPFPGMPPMHMQGMMPGMAMPGMPGVMPGLMQGMMPGMMQGMMAPPMGMHMPGMMPGMAGMPSMQDHVVPGGDMSRQNSAALPVKQEVV